MYMHVVIDPDAAAIANSLAAETHFFCWRRCIKAKCAIALGPDEAESKRKIRWQLHALLVPQECQKHPKTALLQPLAAKWDTNMFCQPIWTETARHLAPQVSPRGCQKKTNFVDLLALFWMAFGVYFRRLSDTKWIPECTQHGRFWNAVERVQEALLEAVFAHFWSCLELIWVPFASLFCSDFGAAFAEASQWPRGPEAPGNLKPPPRIYG